jgi:peroxiredoxin-like protein
MAQEHPYPVSVTWSGGKEGAGKAVPGHSKIEFPLAVPTEFGGTGAGTNPEELLAAAVCGCYSITFGIVAANRKLPVIGLEVSATGTVEQNGMQFKYTAIAINPKITLSADATDEQVAMAEDMAHKADLYCIITNAVRASVSISVHPVVSKG